MTPDPPGGTPLDPALEAVVRESFAENLPADLALYEESDLSGLLIDSMAVVRLLVAVEDAFDVMIPDEVISFELFTSPGRLWRTVSDSRGPAR